MDNQQLIKPNNNGKADKTSRLLAFLKKPIFGSKAKESTRKHRTALKVTSTFTGILILIVSLFAFFGIGMIVLFFLWLAAAGYF